MTPATVVGLLAEPLCLRVFSAIALGATTLADVATSAGVPLKASSAAVQRLVKAGIVTDSSGADPEVS